MRKTNSVYSQTFCIVEFSLNPLCRGRFWKIKLPLHCCSSLAGMSHALSTHSSSAGMAGSLCRESSPPSQPAALWPHGLFCLRFVSCILVQMRRGLQLVAVLVSPLLQASAYPAARKYLWTSWRIFSYPRESWILYWIPCLFQLLIITCFPRIGFKGFPVFNSWIFLLYPCLFRAFLFLVVDTANP